MLREVGGTAPNIPAGDDLVFGFKIRKTLRWSDACTISSIGQSIYYFFGNRWCQIIAPVISRILIMLFVVHRCRLIDKIIIKRQANSLLHRSTQSVSIFLSRFLERLSFIIRRMSGSWFFNHFSIICLPVAGKAATATLQQ